MRRSAARRASMREAIIGQSDSATKRRDRHRERQRDAELAEERAGLAGQERQRHEDRGERRGGRDDREEHLLGAEHRRGARAHALGAAAHDVLEHDDGVVDDEAGGEHQREQGQDVDREADQVDRGERADQRHRDGQRRDQRRAPVAQEEVDDARRR